jgi:Domain of unknown function (DUF4926)
MYGANRRGCATVRNVLGALMARKPGMSEGPSLLNVVALLADIPSQSLTRGQVGTVVELLDEKTLLIEFSDDAGRPYAIAACQHTGLLVLRYEPQAA